MYDQARSAPARRLCISLFGRFDAQLDRRTLGGFEYNKVRALLAYLAMERNHPLPRASLCALLWPDLPESAARQNLSQALTRLRQVLGDKQATLPFLLTTTDTVQINPLAQCDVDVLHFTALVAAAESHAHHAWHLCTPCAVKLRRAVEYYKGDFLAQFYVSDSDLFEEWALWERQRHRQRMLSALERLIQYAEWRGDEARAVHYAQRHVELEPLREDGHRELMRLLVLSGQRSASLAQYDFLAQTLRTELDAEPEAETTALREQIRGGGPVEEFRRLYAPPSYLPAPTTPLIGREDEVQAICEQLTGGASPPVRLLTLTGAPGIGKTRLALEVAQRLRFDWQDGVHWIELAPIAEPEQVPVTLAQLLGIKAQARQTQVEAVVDHLRAAHCLLVFDNFEQVLDAASFLALLLTRCPALSLLVTSRTALRLHAEFQVALEPLALPREDLTPEAAARSEAVQLFQSRARAVRADFELTRDNVVAVAAICRRLDGLPLAIELIATRLKTLTVQEVLQQWESRLSAVATGPRDMPSRHRTLRQAIQWSYDRLSLEEQRVFAHMGVFSGGCTVEAVRAVVGDTMPVLPSLEALHDASLLHVQSSVTSSRFSLLETIGEFALERLAAAAGISDARERHAEYFAQMADEAYVELLGPDHPQWSARIAAEQENLRAALQWALNNDRVESALRIATGIWRFWWQRGFLREGLTWLERALARRHEASPAVQTKALRAAGVLAMGLNDYGRARQHMEQAVEIAARIDALYDRAAAITNLGLVLSEQGDFEAARIALEQGLALNRRVSDTRSVKFPMMMLAGLSIRMGNFDQAGSYYEECLRLNRELGDGEGTANALFGLATVANARAEYLRARQWCEESLTLYQRLNHQFGTGWCYSVLGDIARSQEDYPQALAHYQQCLRVWLQREDYVNDARILDAIGGVWYQMGKPVRTVQLISAARAIREGADAKLTDVEEAYLDALLSSCRATLDATVYQDAWLEGHRLSPQEARRLALLSE